MELKLGIGPGRGEIINFYVCRLHWLRYTSAWARASRQYSVQGVVRDSENQRRNILQMDAEKAQRYSMLQLIHTENTQLSTHNSAK